MSDITQDVLDDIFASVDAREGAANSCDEESDSDLDVPKAIVPTQPVRPAQRGLQRTPAPARTPLAAAATNRGVSRAPLPSNANYYVVQWRKPQTKKHKTWDGDAYLKVEGSRVTMISEEGKHMATAPMSGGLPGPGTELRIAGFDCEVDRAVDYDEFRRATSCLNNPSNAPVVNTTPVTPFRSPAASLSAAGRGFKPPSVVHRPLVAPKRVPSENAKAGPSVVPRSDPPAPRAVAAASFYAAPTSAGRKIIIGEKNSAQREKWGGAIHNPDVVGAVVMDRPPEAEAEKRGTAINDVVLDPELAAKMRDHQKEGVKFMYRCVMGLTGINGTGCILADEMGLGKTLQTIALIYTLCKQSPFQNQTSVIQRALVVCPVSLVVNWKKEFKKWLPRDFNVSAVEEKNEDSVIASFTHHRGIHVLIIGYERLRKHIRTIQACQPPVGLVVCDEGHRLKGKDNKTTKMFNQLSTKKRILLSGTPVQNDLGEYWAMADFVCEGVLGTYSAFSRQYEKPIVKARMPRCPPDEVRKGEEKSEELRDISKEFVLRRQADVLKDYLPPKTEYVVFVAPSALQLDVFSSILGGAKMALNTRGMSQCLATIDLLRKAANSPTLLRNRDDDQYDDDEAASAAKKALKLVTEGTRAGDSVISGKLRVLERILEAVYWTKDQKIVVVSNWTSTLNLIQDLCVKKRMPFLRLDGSTPQKQRQENVDRFNRGSVTDSMIFLLSAKAGGVGLNLIGACRLVLFDSDWNPSTDLQAMARIHRDGQKRPVYIYRLLTTNSIDEKIYQRQLTKMGLSDEMMAQSSTSKTSKDSFSFEELRDIFTLNVHTDGCQTHDLLSCDCGGLPRIPEDHSGASSPAKEPITESDDDEDPDLAMGFMSASQYDPEPTPKMVRQAERAQQAKLAALKAWDHLDVFNAQALPTIDDNVLHNLVRDDLKTHQGKATRGGSPSAKKRRGRDSDESSARSTGNDRVPCSEEDSDEEPVVLPRRRKRAAAKSKSIGMGCERQHDLREMADDRQGGRITFLFQKKSQSRL